MHHSLLAGKLVIKAAEYLKLGSGSTWPGQVALLADPQIITKVVKKNPGIKIILIAGTNGKTTTTKALAHILETQKMSVLTNMAGANLLNGLASLLIKHTTIAGTLRNKAILFEVDENSLPLVLDQIPNPDAIILLNLFRDQLDRYGEINTTAEKWRRSFAKLTDKTIVIANADDPLISYISKSAASSIHFTIDNIHKKSKELSHAVDSITCPECRTDLSYSGISYSHIGNYSCPKCGFKNPKSKLYTFHSHLQGTYNIYNLTAAILAADKIFNILPFNSSQALTDFKPAFGRQETIEKEGRKIMILLSKNPTGLNESLKIAIENKSASILLLLNDRIPDGRDISWIWDVDFEMLQGKNVQIIASGDRAYDLANRLHFAEIECLTYEKYTSAYNDALKKTPTGKTLTILPTYSAMLEIRKLISGKAIL